MASVRTRVAVMSRPRGGASRLHNLAAHVQHRKYLGQEQQQRICRELSRRRVMHVGLP